MTRNEIKWAQERITDAFRVGFNNEADWKAIKIALSVVDGVLRLPVDKKLIDNFNPNMGGINNPFDLGYNQALAEVRKALNLTD